MRAWYRRHSLSFIFRELLSFSVLWSGVIVLLPFYYGLWIEIGFLLLLGWISHIAVTDREPFRTVEDFESPWIGDSPWWTLLCTFWIVFAMSSVWRWNPWVQWFLISSAHVCLVCQLHRHWWCCRFLAIRLEKAWH